MKSIPIFLLILFAAHAHFQLAAEDEAIHRPTEVILIGVLHGFHQKNPNYTQERLRDIILACQPAAILVELPPTMEGKPTVVGGLLAERFAKADEGWACQNAAETLNIPIYPFDRDRREEVRQENGYYRRQRESRKMFQALLNADGTDDQKAPLLAIEDFHAQIRKSILCFGTRGAPESINSEAFDAMLRASARISDDIVPALLKALPGHEPLCTDLEWLGRQWSERNQIMADKILARAKQRAGQRIVVATGAEHRHVLRDRLQHAPNIQLREFYELQGE